MQASATKQALFSRYSPVLHSLGGPYGLLPHRHCLLTAPPRRYNMTEAEKKKLKYFHALRHYERDGGLRGEVDAQDVQAIVDKYEPMEADRRAYQVAKARGQLDKYWEEKKDVYKAMVRGGSRV